MSCTVIVLFSYVARVLIITLESLKACINVQYDCYLVKQTLSIFRFLLSCFWRLIYMY
jgi:hypothetical protein